MRVALWITLMLKRSFTSDLVRGVRQGAGVHAPDDFGSSSSSAIIIQILRRVGYIPWELWGIDRKSWKKATGVLDLGTLQMYQFSIGG